jgi:hypothetical protein
MINHGMEYNSQKEGLIIAQYGRNVQNLINYALKIEDKEKRQSFTEAIIELMNQMNPISRNEEDHIEKLWRHLFRISDYKIDVVPPSGVVPNPESSEYKPGLIPYEKGSKGFRHYGSNVKKLIEKAKELTDEEKKAEFTMIIASYMKLAYRTWGRDQYVNDEIIKGDLVKLSDGALQLTEDDVIDVSAVKYNRPSTSSSSNHRRRKGGGRSNNHSNNNRRRGNNNNNKNTRRRR